MAGFWRKAGEWLGFVSEPDATFSSTAELRLFSAMHALKSGQGVIDRDTALSVPAVLRGRNLICGSISTLPLTAVDDSNRRHRVDLLQQIDRSVSNVATLAMTIEDLIFDAIAWWRVTDWDPFGFPAKAMRLDPGTVSLVPPKGKTASPSPLPSGIDPRYGVVWIDGKPVSGRDYIRFDSPNPALLTAAARTIRRALLLDETAEMYADNPRPLDYLKPVEGATRLSNDEVDEYLSKWQDYRKRRTTAWLEGAEYGAVDSPTPADLTLPDLARQVHLELANAMGLDPEDLGISTTSRTYQNAVDRRRDRINDTLSSYMRAITDTLTMRMPGDLRAIFDLDDYLRADPRTRAEVDEIRIRTGVIVPSEARQEEGYADMTPAQRAELNASQRAAEPRREPLRVAATVGAPALEMDAPVNLTFDSEASVQGVDTEARTITALLVPYGEVARNRGRLWRFERGSLRFVDVGRVKLLRDHDKTQALGRAVRIEETPAGPVGTFRVASGAEGDRALALAQEGVLDGVSVGIDMPLAGDYAADPLNKGVTLVRRADLREVSLTALPAYDSSRVLSVAASQEQESDMPEATEPQAPAAPVAPEQTHTVTLDNGDGTVTYTNSNDLAQFQAFQAWQATQTAQPAQEPAVVNVNRQTAVTTVREALPYRFTYTGSRHVFAADAEHDFSSDLFAAINSNGADQGALNRVNGLISAAFDVDRADTAALNPNAYRPDLWQPQMDYATPLWDMIASGTTDGRSFDVPKFNSASGLVGAATEGTEPSPGSFTVTDQTVTPTQVWGKVEITRQAARRGGNPQLSGIIWDQMLREYYEDREAAVATFLNTLTAATDIALAGTPASTPSNDDDRATADSLEQAIAGLQFVRGGNRFRAFAVHQDLFEVLARVKDASGRPLYPMLAPANANGTAANLFRTLNIAGTTAVPAWALGAGGQTTATNSWLFDPAKVRGWASAPERLDWNFGATVQSGNIAQLAHVTIGIYGDVAFANLDINGVRQVTFDPSV
ncbi:phage portal protein [Asanoa sp. WMMD1127]|uniref:phage portal protein n=1 Tax=Asanoa sp. WMMD1127 TaxID=3016107 RepID=UPI002416BAF1|nr:phage portal protein [Asanoa sp. WMMD1127]MDG4821275.1 phage portal protein [Asanoa sp. WMMD1127]